MLNETPGVEFLPPRDVLAPFNRARSRAIKYMVKRPAIVYAFSLYMMAAPDVNVNDVKLPKIVLPAKNVSPTNVFPV